MHTTNGKYIVTIGLCHLVIGATFSYNSSLNVKKKKHILKITITTIIFLLVIQYKIYVNCFNNNLKCDSVEK